MGIHRDIGLAFEPLSAIPAELGEGPVWSADEAAVWWVDISGRKIFRTFAADGRTDWWTTPEQVGFVALTSARQLVAGMETGLFAFDPGNGHFERLLRLADEGVRFNDATTDSTGRLWAGTMDMDNVRPVGKLLRIDPDLSLTVVLSGLRTPNGLAVDEGRGRLYLSDSHREVQTVWRFDLDVASGATAERKVFVDARGLAGRPDGAALDEIGNYWLAGVEGGEISVFRPDGVHKATVPTPMEFPTKIAFGGPKLRRIYLTSKSGKGGGYLCTAQSSTRGRPVAPFGLRETSLFE